MNNKKCILLKKINFSVQELSDLSNIKPKEIVKFFFISDININYYSRINYKNIGLLLNHFKIDYKFSTDKNLLSVKKINLFKNKKNIKNKNLIPIISLLGNVDNGKTHLLENISNNFFLENELGKITQDLRFVKTKINNKDFFIIDSPGHEDFNIIKKNILDITNLFIVIISIREKINDYICDLLKQLKEKNLYFFVVLTFVDDKQNENIKLIQQRVLELIDLNIYLNINDGDIFYSGDIDTILISNKNLKSIEKVKKQIILYSDFLNLLPNEAETNQNSIKILSMYKDYNNFVHSIVYLESGILNINDFVYQDKIFLGKIKQIFKIENKKEIQIKKGIYNQHRIIKIIGIKNANIQKDCLIYSKKQYKHKKYNNDITSERQIIISQKLPTLIIKTGKLENISVIYNIFNKNKKFNIYVDFNKINEKDLILIKNNKAIVITYKTKLDPKNYRKLNNLKIKILTFNVIYNFLKWIDGFDLNKKDQLLNFKNKCIVIKIFKLKNNKIIFGCKLLIGSFVINKKIRLYKNNKFIMKLEPKTFQIKDKKVNAVNDININFGISFFDHNILTEIKVKDMLYQ